MRQPVPLARMLHTSISKEVVLISSIIVRGLDDAVKQQLASQAKEHGRSMEAEVRDILTKAAHRHGSAVRGAGGRWSR